MFKLRENSAWKCSTPAGAADKNVVVAVKTVKVFFQHGARIILKLFLGFVGTSIIVVRIRLYSLHLKQVASDCVGNKLRDNLGVALRKIFNDAVNVIFPLCGSNKLLNSVPYIH